MIAGWVDGYRIAMSLSVWTTTAIILLLVLALAVALVPVIRRRRTVEGHRVEWKDDDSFYGHRVEW